MDESPPKNPKESNINDILDSIKQIVDEENADFTAKKKIKSAKTSSNTLNKSNKSDVITLENRILELGKEFSRKDTPKISPKREEKQDIDKWQESNMESNIKPEEKQKHNPISPFANSEDVGKNELPFFLSSLRSRHKSQNLQSLHTKQKDSNIIKPDFPDNNDHKDSNIVDSSIAREIKQSAIKLLETETVDPEMEKHLSSLLEPLIDQWMQKNLLRLIQNYTARILSRIEDS